MPIKRVQVTVTGLVGTVPSFVYIETDDVLAKVITPGYLDIVSDQYVFTNQQAALCYTTDFGAVVLRVEVYGQTVSLSEQFPGSVASVSGFPNQINSSGGINPELSFSETAIFPGSVTLNRNPVNPLEAVTKQYVDGLAAGFTFIAPCVAASTVNFDATYNNGTAGVGASLINSGTYARFEIDGIEPPIDSRLLIKNQNNQAYNGIYTLDIIGTDLTAWKLTRSTDYDTAADIEPGDFVVVTGGDTNANVPFLQNSQVDVIGTDAIVWTQFGATGGVASVSGTEGQITSTGGSNPTIGISADYEGQESIVVVGQIAAGEWKAVVIAPEFGGTGVDNGTSTLTLGGSLSTVGNFTSVFNIVGATNVTMPTTGHITTEEDTYYQITGFPNQIQVIPVSFPGYSRRGLDIKISPTYAGQDSIYQVGIISFGTWQATKIEVPYGGTGSTSFTPYGVVIGGTTSTSPLQSVTDLGSEGFVLQSNGPGEAPTFLPATGIQTLEGTPNRITVTLDDTDAVVDIASTYVGQTSITTLGVIETGEWDATVIRVAKGGTGTVVFDPNGLILGGPEAFDPLTSIANGELGSLLMSLGPDELPVWSIEPIEATFITQTNETVTYPNSVGLSTFPTGFLRSETGTGDLSTLIITGVLGKIDVTNGSGPGNPEIDISALYEGQASITTVGVIDNGVWHGTAIDLSTYVAGNLAVSHLNSGTGASSATFWKGNGTWDNAVQSITFVGANGIVITGTNPVTTTGSITITAPTYPPDFPGAPTIVIVGIIITGSWNADTIEVAYGGTGNTTFTPYSIITAGITATDPFQNVVGVGTLGQVLKSADADALPVWGDIEIDGTASQIDVTPGTVPVLSLSSNVVMPGTLTLSADPVSDMQAATKQYVDAIAAGIDLIAEVYAATTPAGGDLGAIYSNGASGVGATLTNIGGLVAFAVDGTTPSLNARILVKNQIISFENGIYTLTTLGTGAIAWVLTRATDYDTPAEIVAGNLVPVESGTVNGNTTWLETATVTTIGIDSISYIQFSFANAVVSVSGTTDRITSTGGTTPVIDIAATYVGQTSLTTLGTITTGTWNANSIALNKITALTASRAVSSDASGFLTVSATTSTELGYLSGVTSSVQAQLTNKIGQSGGEIYGNDIGSGDSYAISLTPSLLAYSVGLVVYVKFNNPNTGSASLEINGLGAKSIKKNGSYDLVTGDITSGQFGCLVYDGTNFQLMSEVAAPLGSLGTMAYQDADAVAITGGTLTGIDVEITGARIEDAVIIEGTITDAAISGGTINNITDFDCDDWTINDDYIQGVYTSTELQILLSSTGAAADIARFETTDSGTKGQLYLTDTTATNTLIATTNDLTVNGITRLSPLVTTSGGTTNAYTVTLSPAPGAYYLGMTITFQASGFITGPCTLNVNSLGAKSIKKLIIVNLAAGDIQGGQIVTVIYDGTYFQIVSPTVNVTGTGGYVLETSPAISGLIVNTINKVVVTGPATVATLTLANNSTLITSGAFSTTLTSTATTNVTFPTSGTLLSTATAVTVPQGGTGQTSYTNGQLLIGNTTGNTLTKATLTGTGNQIDVTNGAGSITLALSATPEVRVLTVKNGTTANTYLNIISGSYTSYGYTSTLYLEAGIGDLGYIYQHYIRCLNIGGGGASNAQLTFGKVAGYGVETENMRITSSGNLLIGTTTDVGSKLAVNGTSDLLRTNIACSAGATSSNPHLYLSISGAGPTSGYPVLSVYANAASNGSPMVFQCYRSGLAADGTISINPSGGYVTMGTLTVAGSSRLTVNGDINATTFNGVSIGTSSTIGKNLLLNGSFLVSQSGTSFAVPASTTQYTSDMWQIKTNANQAFTVTNLTGISGIKVQRNSGQTGTGQVLFGQSLTINQSYGTASNILTLSFVAAKGANYSGPGLDAIIVTGTGSSDSSAINGTWTGGATQGAALAITTTLTRYTFTSTALASNVTQVAVFFGMTPSGTAGADDSYTIKDVKIEIGSVYTGYEYLSYYETLQSVLPFHYRMTQASGCYYAMVFGYVTTGNTVKYGRGGIVFPVQMRATPTVVYDTAANFSINMAQAGDGLSDSAVSTISTVVVNANSVTIDAIMNPSTSLGRGVAGILKTTNATTSFIDFAAYLT